jgi:hypothetical protein
MKKPLPVRSGRDAASALLLTKLFAEEAFRG